MKKIILFTGAFLGLVFCNLNAWGGVPWTEKNPGVLPVCYYLTPAPFFLDIPKDGDKSIIFSWQAVGGVSDYSLIIRETSNRDNSPLCFEIRSGVTQITVEKSKFKPGVQYYAYVIAYKYQGGSRELLESILRVFSLDTTTGAVSTGMQTLPKQTTPVPPPTVPVPNPPVPNPPAPAPPALDPPAPTPAPNPPAPNSPTSVQTPVAPIIPPPLIPAKGVEGLEAQIQSIFGINIVGANGAKFTEDDLIIILNTLQLLLPRDRFQGTITRIVAYPIEYDEQGRRIVGAVNPGVHGEIKLYGYAYYHSLLHEIGHMLHLGWAKDVTYNLARFEELYNRSNDSDFVSSRAKTSWMEDFAEIFYYYVSNSQATVQRARLSPVLAQKLSIVIEIFRLANTVYTFELPYATQTKLVPLGPDGLPVF